MKKTISTLTLLIALFVFMGSFIVTVAPNNAHNREKNRQRIAQEINRNIVCPSFLTENDGPADVSAIIRVTEAGQVEVTDVKAPTNRLKEYVTTSLTKMKFDNVAATDRFVLIIKFRVV